MGDRTVVDQSREQVKMVSKEEGNRRKKILDGKRKKTKIGKQTDEDRRSEIIIDEAKNNEANIFEREREKPIWWSMISYKSQQARWLAPTALDINAFLWLFCGC